MEAALLNRPTYADLAEGVRARARAEWIEWATVAALADAEEADLRAGDAPSQPRPASLAPAVTTAWSETPAPPTSNRLRLGSERAIHRNQEVLDDQRLRDVAVRTCG